MRRLIDGLLFSNSFLGEFVGLIELPAAFLFDQRKRVRGIAIHFIRRGENKRGVRTKLSRSFQQRERAGGIYGKIGEWLARGPIMGWLRGGMDHQRNIPSAMAEDFKYRSLITNIDAVMLVIRDG